MPIYDSTWVDKYSALQKNLPPHIYNAAAMAYKSLADKHCNQAIVLTGRPGCGKSQAMAHCLEFYLQTAGGDMDDYLRELDELLRPFVSIRLESGDIRWLSTRALLRLDLHFDTDDFIAWASTSIQLLESRAARPGEGANYDALARALRDRTEAVKWLGKKDEFKLLGEEFDLEDYDKSGEDLAKWKKAMKKFQVDSAMVTRILCGILLLGQVTFKAGPKGIVAENLSEAAKALGIQETELQTGLGCAEAADVKAAEQALLTSVFEELQPPASALA
jgi:hypothetical protein